MFKPGLAIPSPSWWQQDPGLQLPLQSKFQDRSLHPVVQTEKSLAQSETVRWVGGGRRWCWCWPSWPGRRSPGGRPLPLRAKEARSSDSSSNLLLLSLFFDRGFDSSLLIDRNTALETIGTEYLGYTRLPNVDTIWGLFKQLIKRITGSHHSNRGFYLTIFDVNRDILTLAADYLGFTTVVCEQTVHTLLLLRAGRLATKLNDSSDQSKT